MQEGIYKIIFLNQVLVQRGVIDFVDARAKH